jgi:hypothetical protein
MNEPANGTGFAYGVFSKSTNIRSRSAPVLGRSNFRRPREHGITENLQLADMAVAGDGHTPYFENMPWAP